MAIVDAINVKCDGQTVTEIVDGSGQTLKTLSAEVENADQYYKPDVINAGGELEAGSTIAAGTYFSGAATVPSGGLEDGQTAVYDIPNGKILSAQKVLSSNTAQNAVTVTITLPDSLSGTLPDYIFVVSDKQTKTGYGVTAAFSAKITSDGSEVYNKVGCGKFYSHSSNSWNTLTSTTAWPIATVDGTTLTLKSGNNGTYKFIAGTVTFYAIYTSEDS